MMRLSREFRFSLTPPISSVRNSWAGWPAALSVAPWLAVRCVVSGAPDPETGYLCDIKTLDDLMRQIVTHELIPQAAEFQGFPQLLISLDRLAREAWAEPACLESLTLVTSPHQSFTLRAETPTMIEMTQQFEFSAAHRLYHPDRSDAENQATYGKCSNPNGHGHNYVVEVSVSGPRTSDSEPLLALPAFQQTVNERVIDRLDHKHLNLDVDVFAHRIPSVENIAMVIWEWLEGQFDDVDLARVRVYETPKTWAEYAGPASESAAES